MHTDEIIHNLRSINHVYAWADEAAEVLGNMRSQIVDDNNEILRLREELAALRAATAHAPVPDGYVLVPRELTAPARAILRSLTSSPADVWDDLLAAAPTPAGVPDGYTLVKTGTVLWLLGENGEFECPQAQYFRGNPAPYFWRRRLRADALLAAAPSATQEKK